MLRLTDTAERRDFRARTARVADEVVRLHALPDRFLGRALLEMARKAREVLPEKLGTPWQRGCGSYESLVVWGVVPRLAHTLGETGLTPTEKAVMQEVPEKGQDLRDFVANCMQCQVLDRMGYQHKSETLLVLGHGFVNGNPIASALDRIAPPREDSLDFVARQMREISRSRFGHERFDRWSPEFQNYPGRDRLKGVVDFDAIDRELDASIARPKTASSSRGHDR